MSPPGQAGGAGRPQRHHHFGPRPVLGGGDADEDAPADVYAVLDDLARRLGNDAGRLNDYANLAAALGGGGGATPPPPTSDPGAISGAVTNQTFPQDLSQERGPSDYDVRHNLSISGLWDLPLFRNRRDFVGKAFGGWQIDGILSAHTGFPWTPHTGQCVRARNPRSLSGLLPRTSNQEIELAMGFSV